VEYVELELDASRKGWRCSGCGLQIDCIGRPIFGDAPWSIKPKTNTWIENKPKFVYCPKCGEKVKPHD